MIKRLLTKFLITIIVLLNTIFAFYPTIVFAAETAKFYGIEISNINNDLVKRYVQSLYLKPEGSAYRLIVNNTSIGSVINTGTLYYYPNSNVKIGFNVDIPNKKITFSYNQIKTKNITAKFDFHATEFDSKDWQKLTIYPNTEVGTNTTLSAELNGGWFRFPSYTYTYDSDNSFTYTVSINTNTNTCYIDCNGSTHNYSLSGGTVEKTLYVEAWINAQELELNYLEKLKSYNFATASSHTTLYSEEQINNAVSSFTGDKRLVLKNTPTGLTTDFTLLDSIYYMERTSGGAEGTGSYAPSTPTRVKVICEYWDTAHMCETVRSTIATGDRLYAVFAKSFSSRETVQKSENVPRLNATKYGEPVSYWPSLSGEGKIEYSKKIASWSDWSSYTDNMSQVNACDSADNCYWQKSDFYRYRTYTWADVTGWNTTDKMYGERTVTKSGQYAECGSYNKSCETSGCGIDNYKYCRTSACGVESYKYCQHSSCGVSQYNSCRNSACGGGGNKYCQHSSCGCATYKSCANSACGTTKTCKRCYVGSSMMESCSYCGSTTTNKTCRTSACGCQTYNGCYTSGCGQEPYNSCRTSACGVESYKSCNTSGCGVEQYKQCTHQDCGVESYKYCQHPNCGTANYSCTLYKNQNKSYSSWSDYSYTSCPYIPSVDGTDCQGPLAKYSMRWRTWGSWGSWYTASSVFDNTIDVQYRYRTVTKGPGYEVINTIGTENKIVGTLPRMTENQINAKADEMDKAYAISQTLDDAKRNYNENYISTTEYWTWASGEGKQKYNSALAESKAGKDFKESELFVPYVYIAGHWRAQDKLFNIAAYDTQEKQMIKAIDVAEKGNDGPYDLIAYEQEISRDSKVVYFDYHDPLANYEGNIPDDLEGLDELISKLENTDFSNAKISITISKSDMDNMKQWLIDNNYKADEDCSFLKTFSYVFDEETRSKISSMPCRTREGD